MSPRVTLSVRSLGFTRTTIAQIRDKAASFFLIFESDSLLAGSKWFLLGRRKMIIHAILN
jgi:hypothetical protein